MLSILRWAIALREAWDGPFDEPMTKDEVLAAAKPFLTSQTASRNCPSPFEKTAGILALPQP